MGPPPNTYEPLVCKGQRLPLIQMLESEPSLRVPEQSAKQAICV
jgi:hypothetical protein